MIEEIHFTFHVVNGIYKIFHKLIEKQYSYTYSYTNDDIEILILVQILFCQFLEIGNRYRVEFFSINLIFNGLSNEISHFVVGQKFKISTCLRYVDNTDFVNFLEDYDRYKIEIFRVN